MVIFSLLGWVRFLEWSSFAAPPPSMIIDQSGDVGLLETTSRVVNVAFLQKGELCKGSYQSCHVLPNCTGKLTPWVIMTIGACSTSAGK